MKLVESDVRLSEVCRAVEAKLHGVEKLQQFEVTVLLRSNFESESMSANRNSPCGYRSSSSTIEINASVFFLFSLEAKKAALAHEIAHMLLQFESHVEQIPGYEEIMADWYTCSWDSATAGKGGVGLPVCTHCPNPDHPPEAARRGMQGTVLMSAAITDQGRVTNLIIEKKLDHDLDQVAVTTVKSWRFKPAMNVDGKPVPVHVPIEVTFRMYR